MCQRTPQMQAVAIANEGGTMLIDYCVMDLAEKLDEVVATIVNVARRRFDWERVVARANRSQGSQSHSENW